MKAYLLYRIKFYSLKNAHKYMDGAYLEHKYVPESVDYSYFIYADYRSRVIRLRRTYAYYLLHNYRRYRKIRRLLWKVKKKLYLCVVDGPTRQDL